MHIVTTHLKLFDTFFSPLASLYWFSKLFSQLNKQLSQLTTVICTVRLSRMQQPYDRPTIWPGLGSFKHARICRKNVVGWFTRRDSCCSHGVSSSHARKSFCVKNPLNNHNIIIIIIIIITLLILPASIRSSRFFFVQEELRGM